MLFKRQQQNGRKKKDDESEILIPILQQGHLEAKANAGMNNSYRTVNSSSEKAEVLNKRVVLPVFRED